MNRIIIGETERGGVPISAPVVIVSYMSDPPPGISRPSLRWVAAKTDGPLTSFILQEWNVRTGKWVEIPFYEKAKP